MTHKLNRQGHAFEVEASDIADRWHFWDLWAAGTWEADVLEAISNQMEGGLLFDIGAWIGPIALWAAGARGARVVALEPDPAAADQLEANIALNMLGGLIRVHRAALAPRGSGGVNLMRAVKQGDSTSSTTRTTLAGDTIEVVGMTIEDLVAAHGRPDLVKIDIEGAESLVLPAAGPILRELHVPVLLSVHPRGWFAEGAGEAFDEEFARWEQAGIYDHETYLLRAPL